MPNGETPFNLTPSPYSQPAFGDIAPSKKKNKIVIIIVAVLIILIVGAVVALATKIWDPLWNPFRPEAEKVVDNALLKMKKIKTVHSDEKMIIEVTEGENEPVTVSMDFSGVSDVTDEKNPKASTNFTFGIGAEGMQFSLSGEVVAIGDVSYFKITTIPSFPEIDDALKQMGINLSDFKDQWIKIDPESINNFLKEMLSSELGDNLPPGESIDDMLNKSSESQKELQEKIKKMVEGKRFYLVKKEWPDEKIQDKMAYRYTLALNKSELKSMVPDFVIIYFDIIKSILPEGTIQASDEYQFKKQMTEELNKVFDEFFKKVGDIDGDVWIGKKDSLLYRAKIEKSIDLNKIDQYTEGKMNFDLDFNFSDFDEPVKIEAPANFKTLEQFLGPIIDQIVKRQAYQTITNDMLTISSFADYFYSDDYRDLNCTNEEIKSFCEEIEKHTGSKPMIRTSKTAYCAYITIPAEINSFPDSVTYFCIDSTGAGDNVPINPAAKNYCTGVTFKCPSFLIQ
jgi:hypothetical protein